MSGSDIYELADQNVKKSSVFLSRKENSEGIIEIKADSKVELIWPRFSGVEIMRRQVV